MADAQATRRRGLFHARSDVHGQPANAPFGIHAAAQQHRPGVDADAHIEAVVTMAQSDLFALARALRQQCKARVDRALGVVFAGYIGTEHGQQAIARILKYPATVGCHDGGETLHRVVHDGMNVFRIEPLAQRRGANDVGEQNRHLLELLIEFLAAQDGQPEVKRHQRRVDHGIAQRCALRLQCGDPGFDLVGFVHGQVDACAAPTLPQAGGICNAAAAAGHR